MTINWDDDCRLGISVIDDQHKIFIEILSDLYQAVVNNQTADKLSGILDKLDWYVRVHFATEEKFFAEFNYGGADEHINAHRQFENKLIEIRSKSPSGDFEISVELIEMLENWLIDHVNNMDRKYITCFHQNGLN